jgi:hypothetical protein
MPQTNVLFGMNDVAVLPAPQGSGIRVPSLPASTVLLPRSCAGVSSPATNRMARLTWSACATWSPAAKMLRFDVMAVHGARSDSPWMPGIVIA